MVFSNYVQVLGHIGHSIPAGNLLCKGPDFLFRLETVAFMQIRGKYIVLWNECRIVIDVIYSPDEKFVLP